jgi:alpha-beta hydrolase superfamily lysophospholipase
MGGLVAVHVAAASKDVWTGVVLSGALLKINPAAVP